MKKNWGPKSRWTVSLSTYLSNDVGYLPGAATVEPEDVIVPDDTAGTRSNWRIQEHLLNYIYLLHCLGGMFFIQLSLIYQDIKYVWKCVFFYKKEKIIGLIAY